MTCANHPNRENVAFCQNCGKPLCEECKRTIGNSVFCEPCFVARTTGATPPPGGFAPPPGYVPGYAPPQRHPEPIIAGLLGLIPGVGAMYNEQYAKGIVHLIVFAILVSLADNGSDIFGLFIAGWVFYMAFEAYHTARARRDGTPLPNPFGLNDLGERLGFGKAWPGTHTHYGAANVPPYDPATTGTQTPPQGSSAAPGPQAAGQTYSTSTAYFHQGADGSQTYSTPTAFFHQGADGSQTYGVPPASHWGAPNDVPPVPPVPPPPGYPDPNAPHPRSIPSGAIWLIAIGVLFLIGHVPVFHIFHGRLVMPFFLIGIGVWVFVRRMTETGGLENDGSDFYRWRLTHALNGAVWIVLVGVLWLLDTLRVLTWSRSWPIWMIAAGVLMIFRRTLFSPGYTPTPPYPPYGSTPPATPPPAPAPVTSTDIVPVDPTHFTRNDREEGR